MKVIAKLSDGAIFGDTEIVDKENTRKTMAIAESSRVELYSLGKDVRRN